MILKHMGLVQINTEIEKQKSKAWLWSPPLFRVWEDEERSAKEVEKEYNEVGREPAECVSWEINKKSVLRRKE